MAEDQLLYTRPHIVLTPSLGRYALSCLTILPPIYGEQVAVKSLRIDIAEGTKELESQVGNSLGLLRHSP